MARGDKGTKRRDSIVDEATKLFAERGYAGASMADLAECVGLRKASLFHHFPSKELLYAAVLERPVNDSGMAIARAVQDKDRTYDERLDDLSMAIFEVFSTQPYAARLFVREAMQWTVDEGSPLAATIDGLMNAAVSFIEEGQRLGAVPADDPKQMIVTLMGVHLMAFAIPGVVGRFTQMDPFSRDAIDKRRAAVRAHVRAVILRR